MKVTSKNRPCIRTLFVLLSIGIPFTLFLWNFEDKYIIFTSIFLSLIPFSLETPKQKKELFIYYILCYLSFVVFFAFKKPIEISYFLFFSFYLIHYALYSPIDKLSYKKYDEGLTLLSRSDVMAGVHSGRFSIIDLIYSIGYIIFLILFFYLALSIE